MSNQYGAYEQPPAYGAPAPAYQGYEHSHQTPPAYHQQGGAHRDPKDEEKWTLVGIAIFVLGCFCCPIWLAGAILLNKGKNPRTLGATSLCYALCSLIAGIIILIIVAVNNSDCDHTSPTACINDIGCGWCKDKDKCTSSSDCGVFNAFANTRDEFCRLWNNNPTKCSSFSECKTDPSDPDDCETA